MEQLKKYTFRVAYRYPDHDSQLIRCISFNKARNLWETLMTDGTIINRLPTEVEMPNVLSYVIKQRDKWTKDESGANRLFGDFSYYNGVEEQNLTADDKKANMLVRMFHDFIKRHENFVIKDKSGNNVNDNLKMALFELEDIGASIVEQSDKNQLVSTLLLRVTDLFQDQDNYNRFVDLCYALGIANIHLKSKQELYNQIVFLINNSTQVVSNMIDNQKAWLHSLVEKAIYLPVDGNKPVLLLENDYYLLNGNAIGKSKDEIVKYFDANPSALTLLEQKMGSFHKRVELPSIKGEAPIAANSERNLGELSADLTYNQKKVKEKVYSAAYLIMKEKSTWEKFDQRIIDIKAEYPDVKEYVDLMVEQNIKNMNLKREVANG